MTADQLLEAIGIDRPKLDAWLAEGMPHQPGKSGPAFDVAAVHRWLLDTGRARPRRIVRTQAEVAVACGVNVQTVKQWRGRGLPGKSGQWDLDAIDSWLEEHQLGQHRPTEPAVEPAPEGAVSRAEAERRRAVADAERAELRVRRERGELIEVHRVVREYQHHATHARALMQQMPNRLLADLPETATADDKRRFRERAQRIIDDVVAALHSDLLSRGPDPESPDDSSQTDKTDTPPTIDEPDR